MWDIIVVKEKKTLSMPIWNNPEFFFCSDYQKVMYVPGIFTVLKEVH